VQHRRISGLLGPRHVWHQELVCTRLCTGTHAGSRNTAKFLLCVQSIITR